MRITQIDIKNFRGFYGSHSIPLDNDGKNVVIYGENGSGKSSLFLSLKHFFQASRQNIDFTHNQFAKDEEAFIKIKLLNFKNHKDKGTIYEWSDIRQDNKDQKISAIAKVSGFLDYRDLLNTHFIHTQDKEVNIFSLLVEVLFPSIINSVSTRTFGEDWKTIQELLKKNKTESNISNLVEEAGKFSNGLKIKLVELKTKFDDIFGYFNYRAVQLDFNSSFEFGRLQKKLLEPEVLLKATFFEKPIYHQQFLNEAKLSAIGLSIYLSALLLNPTARKDELKILVLDDVLIGLDMSNRLSVIKILKDHFSSYQIFLLTHDREWFEILNHYLGENKINPWKFLEFYAPKDVEFEIPIFAEKKDYLMRATSYYQASDYKAAAVYLRSAFEDMLKGFCDKKTVEIDYRRNPTEYSTDDFWKVVKKTAKNKQGDLYVSEELARQVQSIRKILLNPLSHAATKGVHSSEVREAIDILNALKQALA